MGKDLKVIILFISILVLVSFVVFVANQTAQFVAMVGAFDQTAGQAALVLLLVVYALLIAVPLVLFIRLPRAIRPPADTSSPEFLSYRLQLKSRLSSNPNLSGQSISLADEGGLEAAQKVLDSQANRIIKQTASAVFVSTAVSQSGRLDGLMVLIAQSRMVWQVSHVYYQRPALRELAHLYANVALTTFASVQIEDLDVGEQVANVIGPAIAASSVGAVPGVSAVAGVLTNAMIDGSANAFLTLRVGIIARRLCFSPAVAERSVLRRLAAAEAAAMFGSILAESGAVVSRAILGAAGKAGRGALSRSVEATRGALNAAMSTLSGTKERTGHENTRPVPKNPPAGEAPDRGPRRPRPRWGNAQNR